MMVTTITTNDDGEDDGGDADDDDDDDNEGDDYDERLTHGHDADDGDDDDGDQTTNTQGEEGSKGSNDAPRSGWDWHAGWRALGLRRDTVLSQCPAIKRGESSEAARKPESQGGPNGASLLATMPQAMPPSFFLLLLPLLLLLLLCLHCICHFQKAFSAHLTCNKMHVR